MINYYLQSVWAPVVIELVPLRGGNEFGGTPIKQDSGLLGLFSKFSQEHSRHFYWGVPPGGGEGAFDEHFHHLILLTLSL